MDNEFAKMLAEELADARKGHAAINHAHEGYAVILAELDEFFDEAKKKRLTRNHEHMLAELVQVAAMAQRTAEDLGLCAVGVA